MYMCQRKNLQCLQCPIDKVQYTRKDQIIQAYSDDFDGIGCFPGPPYHIQVDPSVTPKQTPSQPVPVHLKEPFKQ